MSWVGKNRKINNRGGGGDDYSGLESMNVHDLKIKLKQRKLKSKFLEVKSY